MTLQQGQESLPGLAVFSDYFSHELTMCQSDVYILRKCLPVILLEFPSASTHIYRHFNILQSLQLLLN